MLTTIARFEMRYILRNPLLWLTAAFTFALLFAGMNVEGFELGSEGGLVMNAAYATLRNYLVITVVYMFVTTSFVANAVIRDDETGLARSSARRGSQSSTTSSGVSLAPSRSRRSSRCACRSGCGSER